MFMYVKSCHHVGWRIASFVVRNWGENKRKTENFACKTSIFVAQNREKSSQAISYINQPGSPLLRGSRGYNPGCLHLGGHWFADRATTPWWQRVIDGQMASGRSASRLPIGLRRICGCAAMLGWGMLHRRRCRRRWCYCCCWEPTCSAPRVSSVN